LVAPAGARVTVRSGAAHVRWSTRADGDLNADAVPHLELSTRWSAIAGVPVTWLDEVHGTEVAVVDAPGDHRGRTADALVTATVGAGLGIWVGDCAPVAIVSHEGVVGAAHAGWRGLEAGVLDEVVAAMRGLGARRFTALVGPCIHAECYEFGPADLDTVAQELGEGVRGTTRDGKPALDVPAGVRAALERAGVTRLQDVDVCTACSDEYFSWRARRDQGRQALVLWR